MGIFKKGTLQTTAPKDVPVENVAEIKAPEPAEPKWLTVARKELGTKEIAGAKHNPRIIEYHAATKLKAKTDEVAWCSSFANWCMKEAGIQGTESAWARDWLKWGVPLKEPRLGCIAVYERNAPGGDSHVCFWTGRTGNYDLAIGGNQSNAVTISQQARGRLLGYRWPKGV